MVQINANCSNETILNIYNGIKSGIYNLAPDFQRKLVWNDLHKENFIDTILKGFPFPEIYIAEGDIDVDNPLKVVKLVVDGQQRLSTIVQYIDGDENWKLKGISAFKDLPKEDKEKFYYYSVVVRNLGHLNGNDIKEVFKKINSVNYALNAIEITNALYDGEFITTANTILENNKEIIKRLDIFSINEESRMRDLEFILTLMSIVEEKGYFTTTQRNEFYIKEFNNKYESKREVIRLFGDIFKLIDEVIEDSYSSWARKNNFLTLFVELKRYSENHKIDIAKINSQSLKEILSTFEEQILVNKKEGDENNPFYSYYMSSIQGTGSRASRVNRGKILYTYIEENLHNQ